MPPDITPPAAPDFAQTHPGLGVLRMASLLAEAEAEVDEEALDLMFEQVGAGFLAETSPLDLWPELARGLMGRAPSKMIRALRACRALSEILPETAALFGVPQISDGLDETDTGAHLAAALDEAARRGAPLAVRFALLVMNVGKSDSPPEHLPIHYKHKDRGRPRIEAICARFAVPEDCLDLALMALSESERVHRVSKMRAAPVAAMLERLGAFCAPARFRQLMSVCACDFSAHSGRAGQAYPKAEWLQIALEACAEIETAGLSGGVVADDATSMARAEAIARAFRSLRWSDE
jgi:tRNA nucleotidyltransferase (CCA-adding enzyme)